MSGFGNILEIILVEEKTGKKPNPQTGQLPTWKEARAILRKENGEVASVGRMRVPRDLEGQVATGLYTCTFGLSVIDYGDTKGDILPVITSLTPVPSNAIRKVAGPAPAAS
ncbi:hypothetical protein ACFX58_19015 [Sphingomonas sp. NCPPB 2930]